MAGTAFSGVAPLEPSLHTFCIVTQGPAGCRGAVILVVRASEARVLMAHGPQPWSECVPARAWMAMDTGGSAGYRAWSAQLPWVPTTLWRWFLCDLGSVPNCLRKKTVPPSLSSLCSSARGSGAEKYTGPILLTSGEPMLISGTCSRADSSRDYPRLPFTNSALFEI